MSTISILWALASVLGASLILQGIVLRTAYRRKVAKQHAKHLQFQQTVNGQFEQTKRQIGQLRNDLAAARLQLKRASKSAAAARQAIERELDATEALRHHLPVNGFADTQPSPQVTQYGSLLLL
jgi:hypothetical protein